ncbi:MAG: hypothetical protein H6936_07680 [Burkholderiales bacterium]|nr:hypothetical protein [Burkholderiales bacterium]
MAKEAFQVNGVVKSGKFMPSRQPQLGRWHFFAPITVSTGSSGVSPLRAVVKSNPITMTMENSGFSEVGIYHMKT